MILSKIILKILESNINMNIKEGIVTIFNGILSADMYYMKWEDKSRYLESDKSPEKLKNIIIKYLETYKNLEETKNIWKSYYDKFYLEEYLLTDKYPKEFKKYVVVKKYGSYVNEKIRYINKEEISYEEKKLIIDSAEYSYETVSLFNAVKDDNLREYILKNKIITSKDICSMLNDGNMTTSERDYIIQNKINEDNYLDVMVLCSEKMSTSTRDKIYDMTKDLANIVVSKLKDNMILDVLSNATDGKFVSDFLDSNKKRIDKVLKQSTIGNYMSLLTKVNNKEIASMAINNYPDKAKRSMYYMDYLGVFSFLDNNNLPKEYRDKIIIKKRKAIVKAIKKMSVYSLLSDCFKYDLKIDNSITEMALELRKQDIIEYYKDRSSISLDLNYGYYCTVFRCFLIENFLQDDKILNILENCDDELYDMLINNKKELIYNKLNKYNDQELFKGEFLCYRNRNKILESNKEIIYDRVDKLDEKECYRYLEMNDTLPFVKTIILEKLGIFKNDEDNFISLLESNSCDFLVKNYYKIKDAFQKLDIDFNSFIQYGSGSERYKNWIVYLVDIINSNFDDFLRVVNYLNDNYYLNDNKKNDTIYAINSILEIITVFNINSKLLITLASDNTVLSDRDRDNLKFIFRIQGQMNINSLKDIEEYRNKMLDKTKGFILVSDNIEKLRMEYLEVLLVDSYLCLNNIGGIEALKILKMNNNDSEEMCKLIDELISYSEVIEYGMNTNDIDNIRRILKYYICDNPDELTVIQDIYSNYKEKVRYLFEMDTRINLTNTDQLNMLARSSDLESLYGGIVYDVRDKNYILYGHILSRSENEEDVINGISNGKKNFISMSAISYLGEKYYYNQSEMIFAFNEIPEGSFICSSIANMGSNESINNNSAEVKDMERKQRGILQTSVSRRRNSEILLYREGIKPMGLILPGGRKPTNNEIQCHEKYNIPFIITQDVNTTIENVNMVFEKNKINIRLNDNIDKLNAIKELRNYINFKNINVSIRDSQYTGREVAILTDSHALYEPTLAVLEDIKRNGVREIYSLGDNVGSGPNPKEVIELLIENDVFSLAGNSEYYNTLGVEPFGYLSEERKDNSMWTLDKLGSKLVKKLNLYPASTELLLGGKKIALCHFANDVRWDYIRNSTWAYQSNFNPGVSSRQFLYTNSEEAYKNIFDNIRNKDGNDCSLKGYISSMEEPLFNGKNICEYDSVIQGHVHFEMEDYLGDTKIHTLRAVAMGYKGNEDKKVATYYILKEKISGGYDIIRKNVEYDRDNMIANINSSNMPGRTRVLEFVKAKTKEDD